MVLLRMCWHPWAKCMLCFFWSTILSFCNPTRLKYSQRGFVAIDGFSELTDAEQDDIDPWIPKSPIIEPKIDVETAKFIVRRVSDKFCELVQQERDAQMCAGDDGKNSSTFCCKKLEENVFSEHSWKSRNW